MKIVVPFILLIDCSVDIPLPSRSFTYRYLYGSSGFVSVLLFVPWICSSTVHKWYRYCVYAYCSSLHLYFDPEISTRSRMIYLPSILFTHPFFFYFLFCCHQFTLYFPLSYDLFSSLFLMFPPNCVRLYPTASLLLEEGGRLFHL